MILRKSEPMRVYIVRCAENSGAGLWKASEWVSQPLESEAEFQSLSEAFEYCDSLGDSTPYFAAGEVPIVTKPACKL